MQKILTLGHFFKNSNLLKVAINWILFGGLFWGSLGATRAISTPASKTGSMTGSMTVASTAASTTANTTANTVASTLVSTAVTLKEVVTIGKDKNPAVLESKEKISQVEANVLNTRSKLLPTVSLIAEASSSKDAVYTGSARFSGEPYNIYKTDLRLVQPLYQAGSFSAVDSNYKDWEIQKINTELVARDLVTNIIFNYYKIVLNSKLIETLMRQQKIVKDSLSTAQHRERIGRGQTLDVLQIKTQLALLDFQIESAKNQLQISVVSLKIPLAKMILRIYELKAD